MGSTHADHVWTWTGGSSYHCLGRPRCSSRHQSTTRPNIRSARETSIFLTVKARRYSICSDDLIRSSSVNQNLHMNCLNEAGWFPPKGVENAWLGSAMFLVASLGPHLVTIGTGAVLGRHNKNGNPIYRSSTTSSFHHSVGPVGHGVADLSTCRVSPGPRSRNGIRGDADGLRNSTRSNAGPWNVYLKNFQHARVSRNCVR